MRGGSASIARAAAGAETAFLHIAARVMESKGRRPSTVMDARATLQSISHAETGMPPVNNAKNPSGRKTRMAKAINLGSTGGGLFKNKLFSGLVAKDDDVDLSKLQQPSKSFKVSLTGPIPDRNGFADGFKGKTVQWTSRFEKTLENLIYPTLQYQPFWDATQKEHRLTMLARPESKNTPKAHYALSRGESPSSLRVSMKVSPVSKSSSPSKFNFGESDSDEEAEVVDLRDEDEEMFNEELQKLPSYNVHKVMFQPELPSWSLNIMDSTKTNNSTTTNRRSSQSTRTKDGDHHDSYSSTDPLADIADKGEKFLRNKMKSKYLEHKGTGSERVSVSPDPWVDALQRRKTTLVSKPHFDVADNIYCDLKRAKDLTAAGDGNRFKNRLTEFSNEEAVFLLQREVLGDAIPSDFQFQLSGMLAYRMNNELRSNVLNDSYIDATEDNSISNSVEQMVLQTHLNENSLSTLDEKSQTKVEGGTLLEEKRSTYEDIYRVKHALKSRYMGYDFREVVKEDPFLVDIISKKNRLYSDTDAERVDASYTSGSMDLGSRNENAIKNRVVRDILLLNQSDANVVPESFFKQLPDASGDIVLNIPHYGIGDLQASCIQDTIALMRNLVHMNLRDNRLSGHCIKGLISHAPVSLKHINLSHNSFDGPAVNALCAFLSSKECRITYLDLSKCGITCSWTEALCKAIRDGSNTLEDLLLPNNKIGPDGCRGVADLLRSKCVSLVSLDLSWNDLGTAGAIHLAGGLEKNSSLTSMDLSSNHVTAPGAQKLAFVIKYNHTLKELILSQNKVTSHPCVVFSKTLRGHPSMKKLDLSQNPVGDAGGRAIFKAILRGLTCFVMMRDCSYNLEEDVFNYSNPAMDSPYRLDLSEPYRYYVLDELLALSAEDPTHCIISDIFIQPGDGKGPGVPISLHYVNGAMCIKGTTTPFVPPEEGIFNCKYKFTTAVPTIDQAIAQKPLEIMIIIIRSARTESDRRPWLQLFSQDTYFSTQQVQYVISKFMQHGIIGAGGLTILDIFVCMWNRIVDTENKYDFLYKNLDINGRKNLAHILSIEGFRFNYINPTSHWRIDLARRDHRDLMMRLIAINNYESEKSRLYSRRGDTSQKGNWNNFRNEMYYWGKESREITLDLEFTDNLPKVGVVEFDYVSTTRPNVRNKNVAKVIEVAAGQMQKNQDEEEEEDHEQEDRERSDSAVADDIMTNSKAAGTVSGKNINDGKVANKVQNRPITDDEFYHFLDMVGLTLREKITRAESGYILQELQLATVKHYFCASNVLQIIDCFINDYLIQSRITVIFFSRIWDLHNFDIIMRNIKKHAQNDVINKLGWLNIFNPLKPSFDYSISLKYADSRLLLVSLLQLGSQENGEQIREDPRTDLLLVSLYGSLHRVLSDVKLDVVRFTYYELGERSNTVNWQARKDLIQKFLVGTAPIDRSMLDVIKMFKEMEVAGTLSMGPVVLQYANHMRLKKAKHK